MVSKEVSDPFYVFLRGWLEQTEYGQQFMKDIKNNPRDYAAEIASEKKSPAPVETQTETV